MSTIFARIVDGVLIEYPVTEESIATRSVPPSWYTPVKFGLLPAQPTGYALKETYTITGDTLSVAYSVYEIDLDSLFRYIKPFTSDVVDHEILDLVLKKGEAVVKQVLDEFANAKGYDTIDSLVSYVTSLVVNRAQEAQTGVNARDQAYDAYFVYCAKVKDGSISPPASAYDIKQALPALSW